MKTVLLYPPLWPIISTPYFSLPPIAGFLKSKDIPVKIIDLNIELLNKVSDTGFIREKRLFVSRELESLNSRVLYENDQILYISLVKLFNKLEVLEKNIQKAKSILKDPEEYYDYEKYTFAREMMNFLITTVEQAEKLAVSNTGHFFKDSRMVTEFIRLISESHNSFSLSHDFLKTRITEIIEAESPGIIGISVSCHQQLTYAFMMAKLIKQINPEVKVVFGGAEITYEEELILDNPELFTFVDFFVVFEGESALSGIIEQLKGEKDFSKVPNIRYLKDGIPQANFTISEKYRDLPSPDYSDIVWENYFAPKPVLYLTTSRGCYFSKCTFCADIYGFKKYTVRTAEQVFADMKTLAAQTNSNLFFFNDECLPPKVVKKLCRYIADEGLDFKWTGEMRFEKVMDEEFIKMLAEGGCTRVMYGLESAVPRVIELMKKEIDLEHAEKLINYCYEYGVSLYTFMMSDFPGETEEELQASVDFILKIPKRYGFAVCFTQFELFRFSPMGQNPEQFGLKVRKDKRIYFRQPMQIEKENNGFGRSKELYSFFNNKYQFNYPLDGVDNLLYLANRENLEPLRERSPQNIPVETINLPDEKLFNSFTLKISDGVSRLSSRHNYEKIRLNWLKSATLTGLRPEENKEQNHLYTSLYPSIPDPREFEIIFSLKSQKTITCNAVVKHLLDEVEQSSGKDINYLVSSFSRKMKLDLDSAKKIAVNIISDLYKDNVLLPENI